MDCQTSAGVNEDIESAGIVMDHRLVHVTVAARVAEHDEVCAFRRPVCDRARIGDAGRDAVCARMFRAGGHGSWRTPSTQHL
eukprot:3332259-Alexandrium_andersonii.AAC.1